MSQYAHSSDEAHRNLAKCLAVAAYPFCDNDSVGKRGYCRSEWEV